MSQNYVLHFEGNDSPTSACKQPNQLTFAEFVDLTVETKRQSNQQQMCDQA